ncbi:MAG: DUF1285 domain-containing protein [Syntrophobacteraceae bacterium]|nr:DUF1285 domain-containing protein [Syntrophobacteraceae bacterium]
MSTVEASPAQGWVPEIQSSEIFVDEEGEWYSDGVAISREDLVQFFLEHVDELPDGSHVIAWQGNRCALRAADTPFVVSRVDSVEGPVPGARKILLKLKYLPQPVALDPRTLCSASSNVLYCRVHGGRHRARFSRPAYYQLAQWVEEDPETGDFCLSMGGSKYPIQMMD